jgi:UDP-2-acetamido-3-amino-2,3-dideoxy-glucuronate N-acetyltransferase
LTVVVTDEVKAEIKAMSATIHPSAIVDAGAQIGDGGRIWHWVHICGGARIGAGCSLGQNVFVGNRVVIGSNVKIQNNVSVYDGVEIEDDVFCGPSMVFTNVYNPRSAVSRKDEYRKTLVRRGATLGANCTIVCGTVVGLPPAVRRPRAAGHSRASIGGCLTVF